MTLTDRIAASAARLTGLAGFPRLESDRVLLREPWPTDVEPLFELFSDASVMRYWSRPPMRDHDEARAYLDNIRDGFGKREFINWIIAEPSGPPFIGTCTLYDLQIKHLRCAIGYALLPRRQGQGYAREAVALASGWAFDYLDLHRVEADTHPDNLASQRVLEACRFQNEGLLRERFVAAEEIQHSVIFGRLATDP